MTVLPDGYVTGSLRKASAATNAVHQGLGHSAATLIVLRTLGQLVLDVDGIFVNLGGGGGTTDMDGHNSDMTLWETNACTKT